MIKVITTIGTSLFTNYRKKEVRKSLEKLGKKEFELDEDAFNEATKEQATIDDLNDLKIKITSFWLHNLKQDIDKREISYMFHLT